MNPPGNREYSFAKVFMDRVPPVAVSSWARFASSSPGYQVDDVGHPREAFHRRGIA